MKYHVHTLMYIYDCQKYTVCTYIFSHRILFYYDEYMHSIVYLLSLHEGDNHVKIARYVFIDNHTKKHTTT